MSVKDALETHSKLTSPGATSGDNRICGDQCK